MEKTIPPNTPQRITVVSRSPLYDESKRFYAENPKREYMAIHLDGEFVAWSDAPVERDGHLLLVNGLPYRREHQRESQRRDDWDYYSDTYRIQTGWQVLLADPDSPPHPNLQYPTQDRSEAVEIMRKYVTLNRSAYNAKITGQVVWQERPGVFGEPVAICDGAQHTRMDAGQAILNGEWLPLSYNDEAGDAPTPPASEDPPAQEEPVQNDTTDPTPGQNGSEPPPTIVLEVRYQGTGQAVIPTGDYLGSTGDLVAYHDGRNDRPPDDNIERLRLWLEGRGYKPAYPEWEWLDKGHGPRRRCEVYRRNGTSGQAYETVDWNFLRQYAQENPIRPERSDAERLEIYRQGALEGRAPWQICPECPDLHNCPTQYGPCDRRRQWVENRDQERNRPRLFVPGLVG